MPIITLTTDFGTGSPYVAAMKGVVLGINPAATLVDLTHDVRPQDVRHGAIMLDQVARFFPAGTVHVAVVDPSVGTERKIVYAEIGSQRYVAPDNGLLSLVARRSPPSAIIELSEPGYWLSPVSATFHGRDIMAPVAARLSLGLSPDELGPRLDRLAELDWPEPKAWPSRIEGQVIDVDSFGNLITNITSDLLAAAPPNAEIEVQCDRHESCPLVKTYGEQPPSSLVALVGSSGLVELAVVDGSAARRLAIGIGAPVTVHWK